MPAQPRLDAARGAALSGVLDALAHAGLRRHDLVRVEERGIARTAPHDAASGLDQAIGRARAHLDVGLGLKELEFVEDLEGDVRHLARAVGAVALDAAQIDVREIVVGAALGRGHSDLGRRGSIVDLDPEAGKEFLGLLARERAVGQALLVEGGEVLVEVAGGSSRPSR